MSLNETCFCSQLYDTSLQHLFVWTSVCQNNFVCLNNSVSSNHFVYMNNFVGLNISLCPYWYPKCKATTAGKAGKVWSLPRFSVSIRSYKKQPVKKIWGRLLNLARLKFAVAALKCKRRSQKVSFLASLTKQDDLGLKIYSKYIFLSLKL